MSNPLSPPFTAYLRADFGSEEKLFYAYSRDARHWTALNGGKPVFDSGVGLRDPFLNRADGVYYNFHKPGTVEGHMGNRLSTARSLDPKIDSFAHDGPGRDIFPDSEQPTEGPEALKLIGEDRWYIYTDPFNAEMEDWETTDLQTFAKIEVPTPPGSKHCGLLAIAESELTTLLAAYPVTKP